MQAKGASLNAPALKDRHVAVVGVERYIGELALAFGLLENAHGDQPDAQDFIERFERLV